MIWIVDRLKLARVYDLLDKVVFFCVNLIGCMTLFVLDVDFKLVQNNSIIT